ncbi:MAG TPA: hypothetical protein VNA27_06665 [Rubrobacteraceae bacterium]|nr:hypothetical protein [Rubrobacteraceae bacterium]
MIELLHRRLQEANEKGKAALEVEYKSVRDGVGVYIEGAKTSKGNTSQLFGVNGAEALRLFRYVCYEGFVRASSQSDLSNSYGLVAVETVSRFGLLEIGELPDPKEYLLSGF